MCACCESPKDETTEGSFPRATGALRTFKVEGMTCGHCKASVTEEVSQIPGIQSVEVDVPTGRLTVSGEVSDDDVKAAVEEAGYRVVS